MRRLVYEFIAIPQLDVLYSMRLPHITPIFDAELLVIVLALTRVPAPFSKVFIITDSLLFVQSLNLHTSDHQIFITIDSQQLIQY